MSRTRMFFGFVIGFAGIAGGLIGYSLVELQCTGSCGAPKTYGGFAGAIFAAIGVGIVGTLILRSISDSPQNAKKI